LRLGRGERVEKSCAGLREMVVWLGLLHPPSPKYLITRELRMDKLRVGWGIRARRYEEKVEMDIAGKIVKEYLRKKE